MKSNLQSFAWHILRGDVERDVFGTQYGGGGTRSFPGVRVLGWEQVGNYALRFGFSDGHSTGLYTYDYLRNLP